MLFPFLRCYSFILPRQEEEPSTLLWDRLNQSNGGVDWKLFTESQEISELSATSGKMILVLGSVDNAEIHYENTFDESLSPESERFLMILRDDRIQRLLHAVVPVYWKTCFHSLFSESVALVDSLKHQFGSLKPGLFILLVSSQRELKGFITPPFTLRKLLELIVHSGPLDLQNESNNLYSIRNMRSRGKTLLTEQEIEAKPMPFDQICSKFQSQVTDTLSSELQQFPALHDLIFSELMYVQHLRALETFQSLFQSQKTREAVEVEGVLNGVQDILDLHIRIISAVALEESPVTVLLNECESFMVYSRYLSYFPDKMVRVLDLSREFSQFAGKMADFKKLNGVSLEEAMKMPLDRVVEYIKCFKRLATESNDEKICQILRRVYFELEKLCNQRKNNSGLLNKQKYATTLRKKKTYVNEDESGKFHAACLMLSSKNKLVPYHVTLYRNKITTKPKKATEPVKVLSLSGSMKSEISKSEMKYSKGLSSLLKRKKTHLFCVFIDDLKGESPNEVVRFYFKDHIDAQFWYKVLRSEIRDLKRSL